MIKAFEFGFGGFFGIMAAYIMYVSLTSLLNKISYWFMNKKKKILLMKKLSNHTNKKTRQYLDNIKRRK